MKRNRISVSFVGVFEKALPLIPPLDNKFCRDLFGMPYETVNGLTAEGYVIRVNEEFCPLVVINSQRIIFKAEEEIKLDEYVSKFKEKFVNTKLTAYGLNYEYEWIDLPAKADVWMWNHFYRKEIATPTNFHVSSKLQFSIGLSDNEVANVEIEPRANIQNGIFVSINHHHQISMSGLPGKEKLQGLISHSEEILGNVLFKNIIEND